MPLHGNRSATAVAPTWWPALLSSSSTTTATVLSNPGQSVAHFSQSPVVHAKKHREKAKKAAANEKNADEWGEDQLPSESRNKTRDKFTPPSDFDHEAAFDLGDVDTAYAKIDERFEKRLQEFKASGGRFNPDLLGQLKVKTTSGGADAGAAEMYPLRELASIVHRGGRAVSILVSDASYIKPIMSAVQNSEQFNQQPQRDPDNDLELLLRIEPENPDEQAKRLKAEVNGWKDAVRDVLSTRKSKHATWQKNKHLTKDDVKNLDKKVKGLQDKKIEAIEKKEKQLLVELANRQKRL
ncbi:ribosome recycling factor domain-containing protein [Coniella lustricola]|uniref:Ribosome recycling factor domain-containing protein n=1 Tax=Coniella lustricola TaxID=2025994 RepID=A0A2T3AG94_9PEZI|nr:ribosome recycling factor domain-containing protein [Coniella lustricola]